MMGQVNQSRIIFIELSYYNYIIIHNECIKIINLKMLLTI